MTVSLNQCFCNVYARYAVILFNAKWSEETSAKSRDWSSINKSDKQSCTRYIHACMHTLRSTCVGRSGATKWLLGLLIIPICSIWPGHEKSHVPGVGWRFRGVASPQLSSFQPLTPLKYSSTRRQRWQCRASDTVGSPSPTPKTRDSLQWSSGC